MVLLFHTGIVMRAKFDEPEEVAAYRMRAFHLEEIARRYPKITVIGAPCGNPEYEWAAEVARWNPNLFFDLSGSTLVKLRGRLGEFARIFWWSSTEEGTRTPENNPSAFVKLVFGSDTELENIEGVLRQYGEMLAACGVPADAQRLILGGTMAKILGLPRRGPKVTRCNLRTARPGAADAAETAKGDVYYPAEIAAREAREWFCLSPAWSVFKSSC